MRTQPFAPWRATLAGFASVIVLPAAVLLIGAAVDGRFPATASKQGAALRMRAPAARPEAIGPAGVASLRATRRIARTQLREAATALRGCRGLPVDGQAWRDCVRWPLARAVVGGRTSAGVLYAVTQGTRAGGCREQAMGEASGLRLIAGLADQLVRGLANRSELARSERAAGFAAAKRLIGDVRRQLRRTLEPCTLQPQER
jgi:hypothetical protein